MPLHEHDCDRCRFQYSAGGMDMYLCVTPDLSGTIVSLVTRRSSEPFDYLSTSIFNV